MRVLYTALGGVKETLLQFNYTFAELSYLYILCFEFLYIGFGEFLNLPHLGLVS